MNIAKKMRFRALLAAICLLFVISGVAIYDFTPAHPYYNDSWTPVHTNREWFALQMRRMYLWDQLRYFALGFVAMFIMYRWHPVLSRRWRVSGILALLMLLAPFCPEIGMSPGGGHRWIRVGVTLVHSGIWSLFPAAFAFSHMLTKIEVPKEDWKNHALPGCFFISINALLLTQPDLPIFGLFNSLVLILALSGNYTPTIKRRIALVSVSICGLGVLFHPNYDKCFSDSILSQNHGFFEYRTMLALNDLKLGGLTGIGLGSFYLNESVYSADTMTKFILQIIGREFGFVGMMIIIVLFAIIVWLSLGRIKTITGPVEKKMATAMLLLILLPAVFGLIRTLNLLPFIPSYDIPFLGYGEASVVAACSSIGVLFSSTFDTKGGTH